MPDETMRAELAWTRAQTRVERIPESGCWVYMGATNSRGYGNVGIGSTETILAHRLAYEQVHGPVPAGMFVCHQCDVKCCVNPDHLYAGSRLDNARDAAARKRFAYGVKNGNGRITDAQVREAMRLLSEGVSKHEIGRRLSISRTTVLDVSNGKRRQHSL